MASYRHMESITAEDKSRAKSWVPRLGIVCIITLVAIAGPILLLIIMNITQSLQPGYSRIQHTISMLVLGPYGWLQTVVFSLFGLLVIVFAVRLYFAVSRRRSSKIGIAFLILIGLGFILISIFPTQSPGTSSTMTVLIHKYTAGVISIVFPLVCFLIAPGLRGDPRWKGLFAYTLATGVLSIILIILGLIMPSDWLLSGLHERILLLNGFIWIEVIAIRLLFICLRERRKAQAILAVKTTL